MNKPTDNLKNIIKGDFTNIKVDPDEIVIESPKIRNDILQALKAEYRKEGIYTDAQILNIILGLDEAAEKGLLTADLLSTLKKDPKIINDYIKKLK